MKLETMISTTRLVDIIIGCMKINTTLSSPGFHALLSMEQLHIDIAN
jgi:hypothetical protein